MKSPYLVCYDIVDDRRLQRVFRFMKGRGIHLQYSVFYCILTWPELQELKMRLSGLINNKEDDVRIYPLPADSLVAVIGCGDRVPDGVEIFL
jgi:CRISPR-associated protein Cas2